MESKIISSFDIKRDCRVFFCFENQKGKMVYPFYERLQVLSDEEITKEALVNANDLKKRFGFNELVGIYIARTEEQVKEFEKRL